MAKPERKIPLVREELKLGRRTIETGRVRVQKKVHTREQNIHLQLLREEVDVQRVPVNRLLEGPAKPHYEGDTLVIPVVEEVLVQHKELRVREELRIRRRAVKAPHRERVVLRSEQAIVERTGKAKPSTEQRRREWQRR